VNPYQVSKRAADTLNLVMENRLQLRFAQDGTVTPFDRHWRTVGGHVGWHEALLRNANLFLDAGMIDHTVEDPGNWAMVSITKAGRYLLDSWIKRPFIVLPDSEEAREAGARALSAVYIASAGLQEDHPDRYALDLRPHLDAAIDAMQWRCDVCGSHRWVGWRAGPAHEGFPRRAQCVPCGHVQGLPASEVTV